MADKILRVIFNGICTLVPGAPRNGDPPPKKAFVLMAANREARQNDWKATIGRHFPFVYVPASLLADPVPEPVDWVDDPKLGRCNIYFLENSRVTFSRPRFKPRRPSRIEYFIDPRKKLREAERPGSDDVMSEHDIRWLADMRDVVPAHARIRPQARPTRSNPGSEVAAVVELENGTIKANFPCKSVQPKTFQAFGHDAVPGSRRVLASEFFIDMPYPENAREVLLGVKPLSNGRATTEIAGTALVLRWPNEGTRMIEVRMGNDTEREIRLLTSSRRCDARTRGSDGRPVLVPRDDDFFLHYELLDVPDSAGRPLPQSGPHQTEFDGCKPSSTGGPP